MNKHNFIAGMFKTIGDQSLTITGTATGFSEANYKDASGNYAKRAIVTTEGGGQIRYRFNGTPTASVGHLINPFTAFEIRGTENIASWKAIRITADVDIFVTFEI